MLETADKVGYAQWDSEDFAPPSGDLDSLENALTAFYSAGGYDFFEIVDPEKYASRWLEYVGGLYADIESGKYPVSGKGCVLPLTPKQRTELSARGVPNIFTKDIPKSI